MTRSLQPQTICLPSAAPFLHLFLSKQGSWEVQSLYKIISGIITLEKLKKLWSHITHSKILNLREANDRILVTSKNRSMVVKMRDSYRCHGTYLIDKCTVNCVQLKASSHSGRTSSSQRLHDAIPFINQSLSLWMNHTQSWEVSQRGLLTLCPHSIPPTI